MVKAHIVTKCKPCPFCGARADEIESITGMDLIACSNYNGCGAIVSFAPCSLPTELFRLSTHEILISPMPPICLACLPIVAQRYKRCKASRMNSSCATACWGWNP